MARLELIVLAVVSVWCGVTGQEVFWGSCPVVSVQQNFDINRYMGKWYEQQRFFAIFEIGTNCVTAEYTLEDTGAVKVNNTGYRWITGKYTTAIGDAVVEDPAEPAKLGVRFSPAQPRGDYWVLDTDYDTYTVIWSCTPFGRFFNTQFGWILTRSAEGISAAKTRQIYSLLEEYHISPRRFSNTNQARCPGR